MDGWMDGSFLYFDSLLLVFLFILFCMYQPSIFGFLMAGKRDKLCWLEFSRLESTMEFEMKRELSTYMYLNLYVCNRWNYMLDCVCLSVCLSPFDL
jgi:hypothetical protein